MKNRKRNLFVGLLLFSLFCNTSFSQERDSLLASKYRPGIFGFFTGWKLSNRPWIARHDRFVLDIKYCDLATLPKLKAFNNKWNSVGVNVQFMADIPMSNSGTVAFGIGLGYGFDKFVHNTDLKESEANNYYFSDITSFDKSILRTHTFMVPVEFRFRTKGRKHFKFHLGSSVGYRFGNNKDYTSQSTLRTKTKTMNNFEWLYLDVHARMGMRNWAIFVSANMLPILRKTKIYPVNIGISISLF